MFGRSKPVVLQPYGRRRGGFRLPSWLWWLAIGVAAGVAAVLVAQERYLPPRLTAAASAELRRDFESAEGERQRLAGDLAEASRQLEAARSEQQRLTQELAVARSEADGLRRDVESIIAQLPPDPRDAPIGVRLARLGVADGSLTYDLLLSRERTGGDTFTGIVQFVLAGTSGRGGKATIGLKPVDIAIDRYESVSGSLPLPEGFTPRQATINLLDRIDGKTFGRRVVFVR